MARHCATLDLAGVLGSSARGAGREARPGRPCQYLQRGAAPLETQCRTYGPALTGASRSQSFGLTAAGGSALRWELRGHPFSGDLWQMISRTPARGPDMLCRCPALTLTLPLPVAAVLRLHVYRSRHGRNPTRVSGDLRHVCSHRASHSHPSSSQPRYPCSTVSCSQVHSGPSPGNMNAEE